jgi:hypothetical protein
VAKAAPSLQRIWIDHETDKIFPGEGEVEIQSLRKNRA